MLELRSMRFRKLVSLAALLAALTPAACGTDGSDSARHATVKVGVAPVADAAALYVGIKEGFFSDVGLEVEPVVTQTDPTRVASVVSGDLDFGFANTTTLITARSKGLPVRILSYAALGGSGPREGASSHVIVRGDGAVRTLADLEGKRLGVGDLSVAGQLAIKAVLDRNGVDHSKIEFLEVSFPSALSTLEGGRVDAITVPEPFATLALEAGHRSIFRPIVELAPDFVIAAYFTTDEYIESQADVIARFVRAMRKSLRYSARHPDEVRKVVQSYTEISPEIVEKMTLPDFARPENYSTLQLNIELAKKYGLIERKPSLSELLFKP